jgi:hypothetical protein
MFGPAAPTHRSAARRRGLPLAAAVACAALLLGACSSDDESSSGSAGDGGDRTTTTAERSDDGGEGATTEGGEGESGGTTTEGDTPGSTVEQRPFGQVADEVQERMEGARGDVCQLLLVSAGLGSAVPQDRDEVTRAITLQTDWLVAIAEAAPAENAADAEVIRNTAEAIQEAARNADYSEEFLSSSALEGIAGPEFAQAVQSITSGCFQQGLGDTPGAGAPQG